MKDSKAFKLVITALFAALCFVATKIIQIGTPTGGYIHIGDGFVLLSGIVLGPLYGGIAAAIGSMLADLLSGYAQYAVATFIIKGLVAVCAAIIYRIVIKLHKNYTLGVIVAGVVGTIIVVSGYLSFESILLGNGFAAAVAGVPTNILQGTVGIVISVLLTPVLTKLYKSARA